MRLLVALFLVGTAFASPSRFALVVGNNTPLPGSKYESLRYADDDAFRFAELMNRLGAHTELLVAPDDDTRARFGEAATSTRAPTRANVVAAIERLRAQLRDAPAPREVFIYFSGHGSVTGSDAYLHLTDAPFHRTDLHALVLEALPRERIHVVIDSCHAYFLVNARGRVKTEPDAHDLSRYPDAGFLLSTADRREVHEWDGYRGGVFSYQVLGALHGGADVDEDGVVTYPEAHAYIVAANMGVVNPLARIRPFVQRPRVSSVLVDLSAQARARVGDGVRGRFRIRDKHGYPHLDAHKSGGSLMVIPPPQASLEVGTQRYELATSHSGAEFQPVAVTTSAAVQPRGVLADDFRKNLFSRPLTRDFVAGFEAAGTDLSRPPAVSARSWTSDPLTVTLGSAGVAGLIAGGVFTGLFLDARADADQRPVTAGSESARARAETWQLAMVLGYGAGAALLTAGVLNAVFGRTEDPSAIGWHVGPQSMGIGGTF